MTSIPTTIKRRSTPGVGNATSSASSNASSVRRSPWHPPQPPDPRLATPVSPTPITGSAAGHREHEPARPRLDFRVKLPGRSKVVRLETAVPRDGLKRIGAPDRVGQEAVTDQSGTRHHLITCSPLVWMVGEAMCEAGPAIPYSLRAAKASRTGWLADVLECPVRCATDLGCASPMWRGRRMEEREEQYGGAVPQTA
jgi:hypothetical protein